MILYINRIAVNSSQQHELITEAVIEDPTSLIWVTRYSEPGEFEIYVPVTPEIVGLLLAYTGTLLVTRPDKPEIMYIESFVLSENEETGDFLTIKGRTIDCVLERRIVGYPTTFEEATPQYIISQLIQQNATNPSSSSTYPRDTLNRKIPLLVYNGSGLSSEIVSTSYNGENLLSAVDSILQFYNWGLRSYISNGEINLDLYKGSDKTNVIFSPENENLLSSEYTYSIRGECNAAFVFAEGDEQHERANGTNPYTVTRQYPNATQKQWYKRAEGYTTGSAATTVSEDTALTGWTAETQYRVVCPTYIPIAKKIKIVWSITGSPSNVAAGVMLYDADNELMQTIGGINSGTEVTLPDGAATFRVKLYKPYKYQLLPEDVQSCTVTTLRDKSLSTYRAEIEQQGASLITPVSERFEIETSETGLYTIGTGATKYSLGDVVTVRNSYGMSGTARVSALTENVSAEGYHIYPTFTDWTITT